MAQIWFGDLEALVTKHSVNDFEKASHELNILYQKWIKKSPNVFKNLKPISLNTEGNDFVFKDDFISGYSEDVYSLSFISQGNQFDKKEIGWGYPETDLINQDIKTFTNEILQILGSDSELYFDWQCIADDGYENYTVYIKVGEKNPTVESFATFYEGEADDDWI